MHTSEVKNEDHPLNQSERKRLIQHYSLGPTALLEAWDATTDEARHWKPAPDAWSAHEIVIHCADSETSPAMRIRMLAAEPQPMIIGYDQDAWATTFEYHQLSSELAFATISAVRALTTEFILRLSDDMWESSGTHSESGAYTAEDWLRIYAAHLHDHAEQIRANVAAWQSR